MACGGLDRIDRQYESLGQMAKNQVAGGSFGEGEDKPYELMTLEEYRGCEEELENDLPKFDLDGDEDDLPHIKQQWEDSQELTRKTQTRAVRKHDDCVQKITAVQNYIEDIQTWQHDKSIDYLIDLVDTQGLMLLELLANLRDQLCLLAQQRYMEPQSDIPFSADQQETWNSQMDRLNKYNDTAIIQLDNLRGLRKQLSHLLRAVRKDLQQNSERFEPVEEDIVKHIERVDLMLSLWDQPRAQHPNNPKYLPQIPMWLEPPEFG